MWECHYKDSPKEYYYPIAKVNFQNIDTCICYREIYEKIKDRSVYSEPFYKLKKKEIKATLINTTGSEYVYIERNNKKSGRKETFIFDRNDSAGIDSVETSDGYMNITSTVYKKFRVRKK